MSFIPSESQRALDVASALAGQPADIKRVGPASLDLCKVADGTYDAYFEPMLHVWDIAAIAAGTVVVWEAQGTLSRWDGERIHWRHDDHSCHTLRTLQLPDHFCLVVCSCIIKDRKSVV